MVRHGGTWVNDLLHIATVLIAPKGAESPGSGRIKVIGASPADGKKINEPSALVQSESRFIFFLSEALPSSTNTHAGPVEH